MKQVVSLVVILLLFGATAVVAKHHAVKVSEKAGVGKYLTDTEGKTLYFFTMDSVGKSACSGDCLTRWPIYFRDQVAAPAGVKGEDFGTIVRDDGQKQSTFRGYPLYYWTGDAKAGDTNGQGVKGVWFVIDPANFPPK